MDKTLYRVKSTSMNELQERLKLKEIDEELLDQPASNQLRCLMQLLQSIAALRRQNKRRC